MAGKSRAIDSSSGTRDMAPQFHGRGGFYSTSTSRSSMKSKEVRGRCGSHQEKGDQPAEGQGCHGHSAGFQTRRLEEAPGGAHILFLSFACVRLRCSLNPFISKQPSTQCTRDRMFPSLLVSKLSIKDGFRYFLLLFKYSET